MNQQNPPLSISQIYEQLNTKAIATGLKAERYAGSSNSKTINIKSASVSLLFCDRDDRDIIYHYLQRARNGTITLHTAIPMSQIIARQNQPLRITKVYTSISADIQKYNRTSDDAIVFGNSCAGVIDKFFETEAPFTGFVVQGNLTQGYIPYNAETWRKPSEKHKGIPYGDVANRYTIKIWQTIQAIQNDDKLSTDVREEQIEKNWASYENMVQTLVNSNVLVSSNMVYANDSKIAPVLFPFPNVTSSNSYLDAARLYGNKNSRISFAPDIFMVSATGIITDTKEDPHSGFKYGLFATVNDPEATGDYVTVKGNTKLRIVDEKDKPTTRETCTRELCLADGAGNNVLVNVKIIDDVYDNIVKRSTPFANYEVGTLIQINTSAEARYTMKNCFAIKFELIDRNHEHRPFNSKTSSVVLGDVSTSVMDYTDIDMDTPLDFTNDGVEVIPMNTDGSVKESDDILNDDVSLTESDTSSVKEDIDLPF